MTLSKVIYSGLPPAPDYQSWGGFDPRGMEHVYLIVHTFLDLILRWVIIIIIIIMNGGRLPYVLIVHTFLELILRWLGFDAAYI